MKPGESCFSAWARKVHSVKVDVGVLKVFVDLTNGAQTAGFEYPDIPVMRELGTELLSVIAGIAGI